MKNLSTILKHSYFNNLNKDLLKDLLLIADEDPNTVLKFQQTYSLQYSGEIAERFIERDFIKNKEDLLSLIIGMSESDGSNFLYDQKKIFARNVKTFEKNNDYENQFAIDLALFYFLVKQEVFDSEDNLCKQLISKLEEDSKALEKGEYWFELLLCVYICNGFSQNSFYPNLKNLLINILNVSILDLDSMDIELLVTILNCLFLKKELNIVDSFSLKVSDVKNNKAALKKLRQLRRICFSEIQEDNLKVIESDTSLSKSKIFALCYFCNEFYVGDTARQRITQNFVKYSMLDSDDMTNCVGNEICELIIRNTYHTERVYTNYIDNITNVNTFKLLLKYEQKLTKESQYSLLKNSTLSKFIDIEMKKTWITKMLRSRGTQPHIVKYAYDFSKELGISLDHNDSNNEEYLYNLFAIKEIDIYNFDLIKEKKLGNKVLKYLQYRRHELLCYLYMFFVKDDLNYLDSNLGNDSLEDVLEIVDKFYQKHKDEDIIKIATDFKIEYVTIGNLKNIIKKNVLTTYFNYLCNKDTKKYIEYLYTLVNDQDLCMLLGISDIEVLEIKREIYDKKLLKNDIIIELKPLFVSKEDLEKEKIEHLINLLRTKSFRLSTNGYSYNSYQSLISLFKSNIELFEKDEVVTNELLQKYKDILKDDSLYNISDSLQFYFMIYNSKIKDLIKHEIFSLTNEKFCEKKSA